MPINPPNTMTKTSHAVTMYTDKGELIGFINSWAPQQGRQITHVFELNAATSGDPREAVPGNMQGLTVSVLRYDIYTKSMERAFGTPDLTWLSDQNNPFDVRETWRYPDGTIETYIYKGCWFNSIGRTLQSTNDRIVNVSATLTYTKKVRIA